MYVSHHLEEMFEITPDYRTYNEDLQTLIHALSEDDRVLWVGSERFRPQGTIPGYVFTVPGLLDIPGAAHRSHVGAERFCDLDGEGADAARCAVDQDRLPRLNLPFVAQSLKGRDRRHDGAKRMGSQ